MSNRIDFFQPVQTRPTLPAVTVSILVDGIPATSLELVEIVRGGQPEFSHARLFYNPAANSNQGLKAVEDIEALFAMGKTIRIRQYFNGIPPASAAFSLPIFCGQIENIDTTLTSNEEKVEITARDFSANLERVSVHGQHLAKINGGDLFLAGLDTVFNPGGQANASSQPIQVNGKNCTVFCSKPAEVKPWSYAEAIHYLLCEYITAGKLHTPNLEQLKGLTGNQIVRDLDVTGLNLIEALRKCCERVGLRFRFAPGLVPGGPEQAIVFYRSAEGRAVELDCQQAGEKLSISKTNITSMHSRKNFRPVTHRYTGQGDFKVFEATFELIKAWDGSLEDSDYYKFSPLTNPDFYQVKDVYRKWCLNEAGDYSDAPYNQGDAYDFSKIFGKDNFTHHRRRFRPALTSDIEGRSLGYYLEVSYDAGSNWQEYVYDFNILKDQCGLWLSSDELDVDTWDAAQQGLLKFRITASVTSDERLTCVVSNGPLHSTAPVVEHIITPSSQFRYRKVSGKSIFANYSGEQSGAPDEVDDTDLLYDFIRREAAASDEVIETIDIQTPFLILDYRVGDRVCTSPESRDLLSYRSDNRSRSIIERAQMDFENQCTNLKISRQRK